ncbi:uncharacterized protein LOC126753401 [Bactrocera neohumeralis]|uniref:uncharacterized protein LOC126753401 n=1 Tax=Bactrocera neohumeralis TaxID=98809 RepID=UPI00216693AC|nr:uncharacterized protein LOC126753401 [Bactrocera neohumeralis]
MSAKMLLYTINKETLQKSPFVDIEGVTILNFRQIVEHEDRPGQALIHFKAPNIKAYPLRINTKQHIQEHGISQVNCMRMLEKFVIEKDIYNTNNSNGNGDKRLKVITRRHVLMRILTAPFFVSEMPIIVIRHKHIIYMSLVKRICPTSALGKMHHEFADYCETNFAATNPSDEVQDNHKGFFIYGAKFGNLDLLYSAEASAVMSDEEVEHVTNIVELNSCCFISVNIMTERKFAYWMKTTTVFKWWCKAYLSNIEKIFIGFRNDHGVINQPGLLKDITDLEKEQRRRIHISKAFLNKFLNLVADTTENYDSPDTIIKYSFDKQGNIECSVHSTDEFSMFSADFTAYMREQAN